MSEEIATAKNANERKCLLLSFGPPRLEIKRFVQGL
jgi:hypothetical protein